MGATYIKSSWRSILSRQGSGCLQLFKCSTSLFTSVDRCVTLLNEVLLRSRLLARP